MLGCWAGPGVKAGTHKGAWPFTLVQESCLHPYLLWDCSWEELKSGICLGLDYKINVSWLSPNWRTRGCFWISTFAVVSAPRSTPVWGTVQALFSNTGLSRKANLTVGLWLMQVLLLLLDAHRSVWKKAEVWKFWGGRDSREGRVLWTFSRPRAAKVLV